MRKYSILTRDNIYSGLVLAFPFFVLFSPSISIILTHVRLDEMLVLISLPFAFHHYALTVKGHGRIYNSSYLSAFLIIFVIFLLGLLYGYENARWEMGNIKLVIRPIIIIINIFVLRFWIYRSNLKSADCVVWLIVALVLAAALGYYAMFNSDLADTLQNVYSSGVKEYDDGYSFNMSIRAMSVFSGYDHAAVTYSIGILLSFYLFINSTSLFGKGFSFITIICLLVAILSSARTGFITAFSSIIVFVILNMKRRWHIFILVFVLFGAIFLLIAPFIEQLFPHTRTLERYIDVVNLFDFSSDLPFWMRSQAMGGLLESQVQEIQYPQGLDVLFGLGDNGIFISDVGYVTVFVKYGIVGLVALFSALVMLGNRGYRTGKKAMALVTEDGGAIPISMILPGLMTLFIVASLKGGLYFLTYKTGELFAFILALCIIEGEKVFGNNTFYGK